MTTNKLTRRQFLATLAAAAAGALIAGVVKVEPEPVTLDYWPPEKQVMTLKGGALTVEDTWATGNAILSASWDDPFPANTVHGIAWRDPPQNFTLAYEERDNGRCAHVVTCDDGVYTEHCFRRISSTDFWSPVNEDGIWRIEVWDHNA